MRCIPWTLAALLLFPSLGTPAEPAWPADVPGWERPRPGEHPRLLFRKSDLSDLKKRAEMPEGRAIVARLRFLLDGEDGDTLLPAGQPQYTVGAFTIGHAAGYGLLYQLTGEKKYAELGLKCFDRMLAGEPDRDGRYSFTNPNGVWSLYARDDNGTFEPNVISGIVQGGWGLEFLQTTAAGVSLSGRVMTAGGSGIRNATVVISGNTLREPRVASTGTFGYYSFDGLTAGETYGVTVNARRYTFTVPSRVYAIIDNIVHADFVADAM